MAKYIKGSNQYKRTRRSNFMRNLFWLLVVSLLGYGLYSFIAHKTVVYKNQTVILDNLVAKINELKGSLVNDIRKCESSGANDNTGLITFDPHRTNKTIEQASIGLFQFKKNTVIYYYRTLYGREITGKEAVMIAIDEQKSSKLASDIIFKTDKGLDNWLICSRKVGASQRLEIINALIK